MLFEFAPRNTAMKLYHVEIVSLHQAQAALHPRADILRRMYMLCCHLRAGHASAFRRQEVFRSALRDMATDQFLAAPVVDGCVDKVDARVENGIENFSGIVV